MAKNREQAGLMLSGGFEGEETEERSLDEVTAAALKKQWGLDDPERLAKNQVYVDFMLSLQNVGASLFSSDESDVDGLALITEEGTFVVPFDVLEAVGFDVSPPDEARQKAAMEAFLDDEEEEDDEDEDYEDYSLVSGRI